MAVACCVLAFSVSFSVFFVASLSFVFVQMNLHETCHAWTSYSVAKLTVFNLVCCLVLFTALSKTAAIGRGRCCCRRQDSSGAVMDASSARKSPRQWRGLFSQSSQTILSVLLLWNAVWLVHQFLLIGYAYDPVLLVWVVIVIKGILWVTSIYLELTTTFFALLPVGDPVLHKHVHAVSLVVSFASGCACVFIDAWARSPVSASYFLYDAVWSTVRALVMTMALLCNVRCCCCYNSKSRDDSKTQTEHETSNNNTAALVWSMFMAVVYTLNSCSDWLQYYASTAFFDDENKEDSVYYSGVGSCFKACTKVLYFSGLVPLLVYTLQKNHERWTDVLTRQLQTAARQWSAQVTSLLVGSQQQDAKISNNNKTAEWMSHVADRLSSVRHSPMYDWVIDKKLLKPLNRTLGKGSFGQVDLYALFDPVDVVAAPRTVAVKFVTTAALLDSNAESERAIVQFKHEFANFLELQACPYVVSLLGLFFEIDMFGPKVGLVMEYAARGSLLDLLPFEVVDEEQQEQEEEKHHLDASPVDALERDMARVGSRRSVPALAPPPGPTPTYLRVSGSVLRRSNTPWPVHPFRLALHYARGLHFLHEQTGGVFMDVKPANSVVTDDYKGKLIDLGSLVKEAVDHKAKATAMASCWRTAVEKWCCCRVLSGKNGTRHDGELAWTEAYASPEMLRAKRDGLHVPIAQASDVWSFGLVLWHLVTGVQSPVVLVCPKQQQKQRQTMWQAADAPLLVTVDKENLDRGGQQQPVVPRTIERSLTNNKQGGDDSV